MTHTHDETPRQRSPLDFPPGLDADEKAARWAELLRHPERVTDAQLDAALFEMMDKSRRAT